MAKNRPAGNEYRTGTVRDRSQVQSPATGTWVKRDTKTGREILFPTERSTIGHKKIDRAVERVFSRKLK